MSADPRSLVVNVHQLAGHLARTGYPELAGQLAALGHLTTHALNGRTVPHSPSMAPWPESIASAMMMLGGDPPEDIDAEDLEEQLEALPGGAAYLAAWNMGSRQQWGEGPAPLSDADADAIALALMGSEGFEDDE